MQKIKCEVCGSTELTKKDGLFVCQHCGCSYSLEEVRKLVIEGPVDVTGSSVKIDATDDLDNYLTLGRRARDELNTTNQHKYYELILQKDPNNWEAYLYFNVSSEFSSGFPAQNRIENMVGKLLDMILNNVDESEVFKAFDESVNYCLKRCRSGYRIKEIPFDTSIEMAHGKCERETIELAQHKFAYEVWYIIKCYFGIGNAIEQYVADIPEFKDAMLFVWKEGIQKADCMISATKSRKEKREEEINLANQYVAKIKEYEPDYCSPFEDKKKYGGFLGKLFG